MFLLLLLFGLVHSDICEISDDLSSCYKKFISFEAIGHIHKYLDNDKNGEVDNSEAAKFVRDELGSTEVARKTRLLTNEDPLVSLPDLWLMWKNNPAFNWSTQETLQWLTDNVRLPQYTDIFVRHSIDGKSLPLLAMQNMSYLTNVLLIQNPIDKRKIMLKAMDTVLFGPPQKHPTYGTKTSVVTVCCGVVLIFVMLFAQHTTSQKMTVSPRNRSCPESSAGTERALKQLQRRLDDLEHLRSVLNSWEQHNENLPLASKQKHCARQSEDTVTPLSTGTDSVDDADLPEVGTAANLPELDLLHRQGLPRVSNSMSTTSQSTLELGLWLQLTYELEMQHHKEKIAEAEAQLSAARHACRRLNRKRYNLLGSVRLLHTDGLDDLEYRLLDSKRLLEQLHMEMWDRTKRWSRIEVLTGLELRTNPGLENLQAMIGPISPTPSENPVPVGTTHTTRNLGRMLTERLSNGNSSDTPCPPADEMTSSKDSAEFYLGSRPNHTTRSLDVVPADEPRTTNLSRSYSFVRPFANLWRRKAKGHGSAGMKK